MSEQFEFDPKRYEGHTASGDWPPTHKSYSEYETLKEYEADNNLIEDAPQILAHAVKVEAERDALKQQVSDMSHLAGQYVGERDALRARAERAERAEQACEWFAGLVEESQGVAGYHLNGDIAEWGEFEESGMAAAVLAAIPTQPDLSPGMMAIVHEMAREADGGSDE